MKNTSEKSHDEEIKQWAKFIFKRIIVGYYTEGRKVLPCTSEIKNIKERKKLITKIRLFSGGYVDVFFENYETVKDISDQTCQKLGIPKEHWSRYGCFEITIKDNCIEEAFVEEYNKMADVVASWEHEEDFYLAKLGKKINVRFELYFKMRFYYPLNKELELDRLLLYNEVRSLFGIFNFLGLLLLQIWSLLDDIQGTLQSDSPPSSDRFWGLYYQEIWIL